MNWRSDCFPVRDFKRVTVTRILVYRGKGTEEDPHRNVTVWLEDDGALIAYRDDWAEEQNTGTKP